MTKKHKSPDKPPAKKDEKPTIIIPGKDIVVPKVVRFPFPMGRRIFPM